MFPGAHASVYRNEAGEPIGWDYPSRDDEWHDPDAYLNEDDDDESPECPEVCPLCAADLRANGYPLAHQHADTGDPCPFRWHDA